MPCLCEQCRSRSVGFWRSQLIWICTVGHWVCEFLSITKIKYIDWLKIGNGRGIIVYSAWKVLIALMVLYSLQTVFVVVNVSNMIYTTALSCARKERLRSTLHMKASPVCWLQLLRFCKPWRLMCALGNLLIKSALYSRTSIARTPMTRLPWLIRSSSDSSRKHLGNFCEWNCVVCTP